MKEIPSFENQNEQPLRSQEECRKIAEDLYANSKEKFLERQNKELNEEIAPWHENKIDHHLRQFSPETLHDYWGHGIARGSEIDQLTAAISILSNNAVLGYSAPLADSGFVNAYAHGHFLAISHKGERLMESDSGGDQKPVFVSLGKDGRTGKDIKAVKIKSGAFVVNAWFSPIVPELRAMFPKANILYANELPDYIRKEEAEK